MIKTLFNAVALAALIVSSSVHAQTTPPTEASIRQLFEVANIKTMLGQVETQMGSMMKNMLQEINKDKPLNAKQQQAVDKFRNKVIALQKEQISWEKLEPLFIEIYSNALNQDDVNGIIAFYQSPAGQSYLQKMPAMMQQSMAVMQKLMPPILSQVQAASQELAQDLKAADKK